MSDVEEAPAFDPSALKKKKPKKTAETAADEDADVNELTEQFKDLKKKKKKVKKEAGEGEDAAAAGDAEFDPTAIKKKKKKKAPKEGTDAFDAQLAEAGLLSKDEDGEPAAAADVPIEELGDPALGTGVWSSTSTVELTYPLLLSRFFTLLRAQHPDLAGDGRKSYKIPPPQVAREGSKKTLFANVSEICAKMKRHDEHLIAFLFAELGTSGSVDGSKRLVIRGRFQQKQLENVLRRYILEYVTCKTCKSHDTDLNKGENRLFFVTCNSCGSRRSVAAIKTGFQATVGKRRRQKV